MAPSLVVKILDGKYRYQKRRKSSRKEREINVDAFAVYATSTGAGSIGRAAIDSAAPVLLGAGAISGSGICISS